MITPNWQAIEQRKEATMQNPFTPQPDPTTEKPDRFADPDICWEPTPGIASRIYRVAVRGALIIVLAACVVHLLEMDPTGRIAKLLWFAGVGLAAAAACAFVAMGAERSDQ